MTAGSGHLSSDARAAATAAAIPLLATYFADAPAWDLTDRAEVGTAALSDLTRFVRMRVAIASAGRLDRILRDVVRNPTFHYAQHQDVSEGAVRGRLDVPRYIRTRLRRESPRRYPIRAVDRAFTTPENILAAHAAIAVAEDLRRSPIGILPQRAPERTAISLRRSRLRQFLAQSNVREIVDAASRIRRSDDRRDLVSRVRRRVDGGHIARPEPYRALLDWVDAYGTDLGATVGKIEWAFYDERFDTKLFEIWVLQLLLDGLTERLGPPILGPRPLYERDQGPIAAWRAAGATLRLFYQGSLERVGLGKPRWRFTVPTSRPLGGVPDLALAVGLVDGSTIVGLVDPKLRIREGAPTDELYKVIGYFGNASTQQSPLGAIVFYTPGQGRVHELDDGAAGRLAAIGVDPALPHSRPEVGRLVDYLLAGTGLDSVLLAGMAGLDPLGPEAAEATAAARQSTAVEAMRRQAALVPPATIEPFKRSVRALLQEAWEDLDDEAARMLATAEYFGMTAPDDADHSGPLLGLAATVERMLHLRLVDRARTLDERAFADVRTLGSVVATLREALGLRPRSLAARRLAAEIDRQNLDRVELSGLVDALQMMNTRYRIPAAHRDLVDQHLFETGRMAILRPDTGVLPALLHALVRH